MESLHYKPHKHRRSRKMRKREDVDNNNEKTLNNDNNSTVITQKKKRSKSCPSKNERSKNYGDRNKEEYEYKVRSLLVGDTNGTDNLDSQNDKNAHTGEKIPTQGTNVTQMSVQKQDGLEVQKSLGINELGREQTTRTLESTDLYNTQKELEEYEKKKKKKKDKLRSEIDELRKKRDGLKVSMKLEQLKKESELLEKQKELNEFEEELLKRQEDMYEREQSLQDTLILLEKSEAAMARRRDILQRKQDELSNMAKIQDLGVLHQQLGQHKHEVRRKSEDNNPSRELARLNWDFLKSVFQDRTAMLASSLKSCKIQLTKHENLLREKTTECEIYKKLADELQEKLNQREAKIKELENHLSLTLQQQAKEVRFNEDEIEDPKNDNRGFFSRRRSTRKSINGDPLKMNYDYAEDRYVSQTCNIM